MAQGFGGKVVVGSWPAAGQGPGEEVPGEVRLAAQVVGDKPGVERRAGGAPAVGCGSDQASRPVPEFVQPRGVAARWAQVRCGPRTSPALRARRRAAAHLDRHHGRRGPGPARVPPRKVQAAPLRGIRLPPVVRRWVQERVPAVLLARLRQPYDGRRLSRPERPI